MVNSANNPTYKVGFDLGGTKIEIIVLSQSGKCLLRKRTPTPSQKNHQDLSQQYLAILSSIKQLLLDSEKELKISLKNQGSSIGIGIPGAISPSTGLVKNANTVCLIGKAFQQDLEDILNCNIHIANDADCFVLSEAIDGAGQGARSVFGVIIGTGCGGGLVINQQLVGGPNAISGEWGHNPLPWAEDNELLLPCYCGKQGCIETFLSGPGFTQHANKLTGENKSMNSAKDWHERLLNKDPNAMLAFDRYARQLAKALASVINIVDPEVIVLGGGMSNIDFIYQKTAEILPEYVFSDQVFTKLVKAQHGDSSGVRGAAFLAQ